MKTRRASSDPLALTCPASMHPDPDEITVNPTDKAGTIGTATHKMLEHYLREDIKPKEWYAERYGLNDNELRDAWILRNIGIKFIKEYLDQFDWELVSLEVEMVAEADGCKHTGHADIVIKLHTSEGLALVVIDWKTTRLQTSDYYGQLMRYMWLLATKYPEADLFQCITVFLRDATVSTSDIMGRKDLDAYQDEYNRRVNQWDGKEYCPGGQCLYCPRQLGCQALIEYLKQAKRLALTVDIGTPGKDEIWLVQFYQDIRLLEKFIEKHVDAIKCQAMGRDDKTLRGDGKNLEMRQSFTESIKYGKGKEVIQKYVTEQELADCCTVTKGLLMDIVAEKAPRGQKGKMKDMVLGELRDAGAVDVEDQWRPTLVKGVPEVKEETLED